jgi:MerR family transcriptional regulator/heat shock protein HspR
MKPADNNPVQAIQRFEPDSNAVYTIDATGHIANVSRRAILIYYKHGLVSPVVDPDRGGYYFNHEAIRTLRRIEYLRANCGINIVGIKMILRLTNEVERLRSEARFLRK